MREIIGSEQDGANSNMNSLNNVTNRNGKRVVQWDSEKIDAKKNFGKCQGRLKDWIFMRELGVPAGTLVEKEGMMIGSTDQPLDVEKKIKDLFSSGYMYPFISKNCASLAHGFTDTDNLGQCSTPPQCTYSSEPSVEVEEDYLNNHEDDTADSVTYDFLTREGNDKYGTCGLISVLSSEGEVDSSGDHNNHLVSNPSRLSDYKMDDIPKVPNATPSCEIGLGKESTCKCSFCLKAAYIWADLHYQDIRGGLSALRKSKKLVKSLEERIASNDYESRISGDGTKKSVELDVDLMNRWRSLVRHTDIVLVHETAKLHSTFLRLKALKVTCQKDLERTSSFPLPK